MAARRLIAVLIMLLVISSLAAALAPERPSESDTTETETTTAPEPARDPSDVLSEVIPPEPEKPVVIKTRIGDQLQLQVEAAGPIGVEILTLGLTSFAAPGAPARFDLLLRAAGNNPVALEDGTVVARIRVAEEEQP